MLVVEYFVAPSSVHGLGVFAKNFIPYGALVWLAHPSLDREIPRSELESLPIHVAENIKRHAEYLPDKDVLRLSADGTYYMNHGDSPNLRDAGDAVYAARDILAGEELLCDYRVVKVLAFDPDGVYPNRQDDQIVGA